MNKNKIELKLIAVRINEDLYERMREIRYQHHMSMQEIVNRAIEKFTKELKWEAH